MQVFFQYLERSDVHLELAGTTVEPYAMPDLGAAQVDLSLEVWVIPLSCLLACLPACRGVWFMSWAEPGLDEGLAARGLYLCRCW